MDSANSGRPSSHSHSRSGPHLKRDNSGRTSDDSSSSPRIAHTLTACCRCRTRKTRCDPGLPRCTPCERTNSHCEYWDATKGVKIPRNYVVHLQQKVRDLERQLAELEKDDADPDPDEQVRRAADVRLQESDETKYLGTSSGIAITRLVMELAKQFTDSKSITDIIPDARARYIKEQFIQEEEKPTSKIYPLISHVAAQELPTRDLTNLLVQLFYSKVHAMYPIFHEPTFLKDVDAVYNGSTDAFQNFALRMVIAISLQRMDTQYAGLADSYYLAALEYLIPAVKPMNLRTIQCFILIAGYSLLTPTRTAVYYVVGLAVRLCQALGLNEEKTIVQDRNGQRANALEIDMRRRVFWSVSTMEFGLAHSLGRPSCLATSKEHIDVGFPEPLDDEYITADGILPAPQPSLKKWIAIHFYKMRLLQLEIRRKLYQRKRPQPKDDQDPWFREMEEKLIKWRDVTPDMDAGSGLDKVWFLGRYNTMIVFMYRPSPQVPRPSLRAARECYKACSFNVYMHLKQIQTRSIEMTWIFTQSIFMAINTILWSLSYEEIRREHPREEVEKHLATAVEAISLGIERWPGVASALELYRNLIEACMKIYDKEGDVQIAAGSPSDAASVVSSNIAESINRSRTTSPATASTHSIPTPTDKPQTPPTPFSYMQPPVHNTPQSIPRSHSNFSQPSPAQSYNSSVSPAPQQDSPYTSPRAISSENVPQFNYENTSGFSFDPTSYSNPLPSSFPELFSWNPNFNLDTGDIGTSGLQTTSALDTLAAGDMNAIASSPGPTAVYSNTLYAPSWTFERPGMGLNHQQQVELMNSLESDAPGQIQTMINASNRLFYPGQNKGY